MPQRTEWQRFCLRLHGCRLLASGRFKIALARGLRRIRQSLEERRLSARMFVLGMDVTAALGFYYLWCLLPPPYGPPSSIAYAFGWIAGYVVLEGFQRFLSRRKMKSGLARDSRTEAEGG